MPVRASTGMLTCHQRTASSDSTNSSSPARPRCTPPSPARPQQLGLFLDDDARELSAVRREDDDDVGIAPRLAGHEPNVERERRDAVDEVLRRRPSRLCTPTHTLPSQRAKPRPAGVTTISPMNLSISARRPSSMSLMRRPRTTTSSPTSGAWDTDSCAAQERSVRLTRRHRPARPEHSEASLRRDQSDPGFWLRSARAREVGFRRHHGGQDGRRDGESEKR